MDDWQKHAINNLRERHVKQLTESAARIQEHIAYVIARIEKGEPMSAGLYAAGIASAADEIVQRIASLEAMKETLDLLATTDEREHACPEPADRYDDGLAATR